MLNTRIIPILLIQRESLVKTRKFARPRYVGDPINTVKIFNELMVDEICLLDITKNQSKKPNFDLLCKLAEECFIPLSYGGGINNIEDAKRIFRIGYEKIVVNTAGFHDPNLISDLADIYGNQAIVISLDVRRNLFGNEYVFSKNGTSREKYSPEGAARYFEKLGAGEIMLTSINREGSYRGYDTDLIERVSSAVSIPVIANGGAGSIKHLEEGKKAGASALGAGSFFVFQRENMGVLINYLTLDEKQIFE